MNDIVDVAQRQLQAVAVAHIADEITHEGILLDRVSLVHFELLQLVARKYDETARAIAFDDGLQKMLPERSRSTGDQHGLVVQIEPGLRKVPEQRFRV